MRPLILTMSLPSGASRTARCLSPRHAAFALRSFAARLGVSVLAIEWSARAVRA